MKFYDTANIHAINGLNQRGGRMLSIVDLINAGTLSVEMAAELALLVRYNRSFLTAAGPGGVGKTTLMAALLGFLPQHTEIVTIPGEFRLKQMGSEVPDHHTALMVHEIGSGTYFSYLWGKAVGLYFSSISKDYSVVSNLHAETYDEAKNQLTGHPLSVTEAALSKIDFFAFMKAGKYGRRVTEVWYADGKSGHIPAWKWERKPDQFISTLQTPFARLFHNCFQLPEEKLKKQAARMRGFINRVKDDGIVLLERVQRRFLREYK